MGCRIIFMCVRTVLLIAGLASLAALPLHAQIPPGFTRNTLAQAAVDVQTQKSAPAAFAIEAAGGAAGSLLGFAVVYSRADDCDVEDLGCNLESVFTGIALGTALSAAGAYLAGRAFHTEPSGLGATLGAVAGAAAGIGVWHLFTEEFDVVNNRAGAVGVYVVTQGLVTALGSRLVRALR